MLILNVYVTNQRHRTAGNPQH